MILAAKGVGEGTEVIPDRDGQIATAEALLEDSELALAEAKAQHAEAKAQIDGAAASIERIERNIDELKGVLVQLGTPAPQPQNGHMPQGSRLNNDNSIESIERETDPPRFSPKPRVERQARPEGVETLGLEPDTVAWLQKMSIRTADHLKSLRAKTLQEKGKIPPAMLQDIEAKVTLRQD